MLRASLAAQTVKNLPGVAKSWIQLSDQHFHFSNKFYKYEYIVHIKKTKKPL